MKMDDLSDYEKEFTCSLNPKVPRDRAIVLKDWADDQDKCLAELIDKYEHEFDVSYGPQLVDIWYPKNRSASSQIHVFTHGGYWLEFTKRSYCSVLNSLLSAGFIVIMVEYTYASKIPLSEVVKQVETAILFASEKFPNVRLTISGHSAGGHLTSKALENPKIQQIVKSAIIITAVFEVLPLMGTSVGDEIRLTKELGKQMNVNENEVAKFKGDILILSAEYDSPKLKKQSVDFVEKLSRLKSNVKTQHFDEDHFTIAIKMHDPKSEISKTVVQFLQNSS